MFKNQVVRPKNIFIALLSFGLIAGVISTPANAAPKNLARAVVQADWLEKNLDNPDVKIIEVSTEAGLRARTHQERR